ncbi:MAG: PQQ-like beta-propeller repeat protein, partial [Planctomycetales bacterium]|nr:PQQ-like beta-propeller repeat protein [Planctomycetales bacterium]
MAMTRSILALDAETGAFCWEFFHRDVHYMQTSSFADGKLLVWLRSLGRSRLVALDADTGELVWEKQLTSSKGVIARRSGPAIDGDRVVVADADGMNAPSIICFDIKDGSERWRKTFDERAGKQIVAPSIAAGKVFTGTQVQFRREVKTPVHGAAIALEVNNGKEIWRNTELVPTRPIVSDGKIAVVKFNGQPAMPKGRQKVSVLDAANGKELWSVPIWIVYGTTTITDSLVILKYYGARMVAYDRETGRQIWESRYGGGSGCSSPSISGKYAFVGTGSFNDSEGIWAWRFASPPHTQKEKRGVCWSFHAIDLDSGQSVWHCETGNNACGDPALAYGKLYLNSRDGRIYCYQPIGDGASQPTSLDKNPNVSAETVRKLLSEKLADPR